MSPLSRALFASAALALAGCAPPSIIRPYRINIQQGNYVDQDMVSRLKTGMTRDQVRFVLGTPLVALFEPEPARFTASKTTRAASYPSAARASAICC